MAPLAVSPLPGDVAAPIPARKIASELQKLDITHVITVPDTHQMTLIHELALGDGPTLLTACTEDEAIAINAGMYIGGLSPMLLIQNRGLYASMNALLGISLDGRVPTCMLVGELFRDPSLPAVESPIRAVNLAHPTMEAWRVPSFKLETDADLPVIAEAHQTSLETCGPAVVFVGAATD